MVSLSTTNEVGSFYLITGMIITVSGVNGMHQVNGKRYIVGNLDSIGNTFDMYDLQYSPVNTSNFPSYISGGQVNIISYPAQAGQPPGLMYNTQSITI